MFVSMTSSPNSQTITLHKKFLKWEDSTVELTSLAILGVLALVAPLIARATSIPCVVIEMIAGIILGKSLLGLINVEGPWASFLFEFGLIYLLFLAGLEIEARFLKENILDSLLIGSLSTAIPFVLGYLVGTSIGVNPILLGVIFSTTSVGVVLPTAKEIEHLFKGQGTKRSFSKLLIGATAVSDMESMFVLAFLVEGGARVETLATVMVMFLLFLIPLYRAAKAYSRLIRKIRDLEERYHFTTRLSMVLMIIFAALAEVIGIHAVVGAFFAGILVSELAGGYEKLADNLASFGYALFLPMFFLITGAKADIPAVITKGNLLLLPLFLFLSYAGKLGGVYAPAKARGMDNGSAIMMGTLMWAKLSLVIAAVEAGLSLGFIKEEMYSTIILFALLTVLLAPLFAKLIVSRFLKKEVEVKLRKEIIYRPPGIERGLVGD